MSNELQEPTEQEQKDQWRKEFEESETIQAYFKRYVAFSVSTFINMYVGHKYVWYKLESDFTDLKEEKDLKWVNKAHEQLELIQHKKLFDAQCLWRAENIQIKEVEISEDFNLWNRNILNCPFIEPVTQEDINLAAKFLEQNTADLSKQSWSIRIYFSDYKSVIRDRYSEKKADEDGLGFSAWYAFYNNERGTDGLMQLPDKRGEKEEFYTDLYIKNENKKKQEQNPELVKEVDDRPIFCGFDDTFRAWFVETFENKKTQNAYKTYMHATRNDDLKRALQGYLSRLLDADEQVPIEANDNWAAAIRKIAIKYSNKKTIEALPEAWEQYMINVNMGIGFPVKQDIIEAEKKVRDAKAEQIIAGRILNGEPGDFNF